ncbi:MAG: DNA repair exonuclease [Planctomycetaceae bacterium]|nr:DNA repair exonuclease [Planctomycetaceae bacterium]MBV8383209.1 DNA repair exonuclease [Planctomycetaceae bacterium]
MIRFLHAADFHLGLRVTRFEEDACNRVGEARFTALQKLRESAARLRVDFILVAGDVFDDHSVPRSDAARAFPILESSRDSCPVFIIPGNHDPLVPGGVWDRDPWLREQPHLRVHFLRKPEPVAVPSLPVTIFPCPLRQRRSLDDPTAWIEKHPRTDDGRTIRIGLAHGSLDVMPLPDDDHLIRPDAAEHYGLDYLALGHWHKRSLHRSSDGVERTAYSGTHEPMIFREAGDGLATGWSSFSTDGDAERFRDDGNGIALLVAIEAPNAPPRIEPVEIGRLRWSAEQRDVTGQQLGALIRDYSRRESPELTILRLTLSGVMDPQGHSRLDELRQIVENRYHPGSCMDADGVLIEPSTEQLLETVGTGVLNRVLDRLKVDVQSTDPTARRVAEHALKLLYRVAWEEQPA